MMYTGRPVLLTKNSSLYRYIEYTIEYSVMIISCTPKAVNEDAAMALYQSCTIKIKNARVVSDLGLHHTWPRRDSAPPLKSLSSGPDIIIMRAISAIMVA